MATDGTTRSGGSRTGRAKLYDRPLKVMLTESQHEKLGEIAQELKQSKASVLRLLIEGHKSQSNSQRPMLDPQVYEQAIEAMNGARAEVNRVGGNLYRMVRDLYQVPHEQLPTDLQKIREDHEEAVRSLVTIARWIDQVAP